jgi:hypothetical protein
VADQGDLSTFYAYDTLNAEGYRVIGAKAYPETLPGLEEAEKLDARELLRSGYAYLRLSALPKDLESSPLPLHLVRPDYKVPAFYLNIGINPTFFLQKDGTIQYAVINGFLINLQDGLDEFGNALIYR